MRSASACAAASTDSAFSISETSAEPITAASAATEDGNMARQRNSKTYCDRNIRVRSHATNQRREIVGQ